MAVRTRKKETFKEIEKLMASKVSVTCAFCKGTGKDPFGLLSPLSSCQVCGGKGEVRIRGPAVKCAFCKGSGMQPNSTDKLHCMACGGKGWVTTIEPSVECPDCNGTGLYHGDCRRHCPRCNGQGIVMQKSEDQETTAEKRRKTREKEESHVHF